MGKLPAIFIAIMAIWLAWNVIQVGPENALGGLGDLISQPQYGEADRKTKRSELADRVLAEEEHPVQRPD
jgi:hypothetical protein